MFVYKIKTKHMVDWDSTTYLDFSKTLTSDNFKKYKRKQIPKTKTIFELKI